MSSRPSAPRPRHWLWPILFVLALVTALFAWVVIALQSGRPSGWMAVVVAAELALMLHLGTLGRGWTRRLLVAGGTLITAGLAVWLIAAGQIGGMMGLGILESGMKLGPYLGWTLIAMGNGPAELAWLALGLIVGGLLSR